jgi:hypothetical protein
MRVVFQRSMSISVTEIGCDKQTYLARDKLSSNVLRVHVWSLFQPRLGSPLSKDP